MNFRLLAGGRIINLKLTTRKLCFGTAKLRKNLAIVKVSV